MSDEPAQPTPEQIDDPLFRKLSALSARIDSVHRLAAMELQHLAYRVGAMEHDANALRADCRVMADALSGGGFGVRWTSGDDPEEVKAAIARRGGGA